MSPRRTAGPLNWNVPIVNADRTPTKEFMQKWVLQAAINGNIPALSTPAQVSAILDIINGDPNDILVRGAVLWEGRTLSQGLDLIGSTRGDLLVRKASNWDRLASPADTAKFLNGATDPVWGSVHDSDLVLSDITTNDVSISRHGFAPKLPNDATMFLDGTGVFSTPSGGGGGGGDFTLLATYTPSAAAVQDIPIASYAATYSCVEIRVIQCLPATDGASLSMRFSTNGGSSFDAGGSDYSYGNQRIFDVATVTGQSTAADAIQFQLGNGIGSGAAEGIDLIIGSSNFSNTAQKSRFWFDGTYYTDNDHFGRISGSGGRNVAQDTTDVRLLFTSGNIATAIVKVYGVK